MPGIFLLGAIGIALLTLQWFRVHQTKKKNPVPLSGDLSRGPGQSLLQQIDEVNDALQVCFFGLGSVPAFIFAAHLSCSYFGRAPETWPRVVLSAVSALAFAGYYLSKLLHLLADRNRLRSGYEGQVAVGQELNRLTAEGYRVFHDFPAEDFKIGHIVVGPTGIMVVETIMRSRGRNCNDDKEAVVVYNGRMLHFPKFSDYEIIDRAKSHAEWLSEWLSLQVGQDICARAMVAVPGWTVKRISADGISVVNPGQFPKLFRYMRPRPISEDLMEHIVRLIKDRSGR